MYNIVTMNDERDPCSVESDERPRGMGKWKAVILVLLVLSIIVPVAFFALFIGEEGGTSYRYCSYKEFYDQHENLELKAGDMVYIRDTLSGIWYDQSTQYTYLRFESMDEDRNVSWGYDAGYLADITHGYSAGDSVTLEIEIAQEMSPQGTPILVGHIRSIEHT